MLDGFSRFSKWRRSILSWDFSSSGLAGHHWRLHWGRQHPREMVSNRLSALHRFNMISIICYCFQLFSMVDKRSKMFNHLITFWLSNMDQCASKMKALKPIFSSLLTKKDFSPKSRSINHPPVIVSSDWVILAPLLLSFLSLTMFSLGRSEISSGFLENVTFCATPTTSCMSWWDQSERRIQFVVHQLLCRLWWQFIRCTKLQALIWWVWLFFYLAQILGLILSPLKGLDVGFFVLCRSALSTLGEKRRPSAVKSGITRDLPAISNLSARFPFSEVDLSWPHLIPMR